MRQNLEFLLYDWLDVTGLTVRQRFGEHSRETFDAVLDLSETLASTYFAPHNKKGDQRPPILHPDGSVTVIDEVKTAVKAYASSGLIAAPFAPELGGMHLPSSGAEQLRAVTGVLTAADDVTLRMAHASTYLEAAGHVVVAWMWLEQAIAVASTAGAFADGKRTAARYFFVYELPKTAVQFAILVSLDRTFTDLDPAQF